MERDHLIWSEEHKAWWRPDSAGYSQSMQGAGLYTFEEAHRIARNANAGGTFCEVAVLAPDYLPELRKMKSGGR